MKGMFVAGLAAMVPSGKRGFYGDQGTFIWDDSFPANAALTGKRGFFVELLSTGKVDVVNAATDVALGVLLDEPAAADRAGAVRLLGEALVVSDGSGTAIAIGDLIGANAVGKAVKKATNDFAIRGVAKDASSADGTLIRVLLFAPAYFRTAAG